MEIYPVSQRKRRRNKSSYVSFDYEETSDIPRLNLGYYGLDALSGDTMKTKTVAEVRDLINNMPLKNIDHIAEIWVFK